MGFWLGSSLQFQAIDWLKALYSRGIYIGKVLNFSWQSEYIFPQIPAPPWEYFIALKSHFLVLYNGAPFSTVNNNSQTIHKHTFIMNPGRFYGFAGKSAEDQQ